MPHDFTDNQLAKLFKSTYSNTNIGKTWVTPDYRFFRPNDVLCRMFGVTAAELENKSFADITPPIIKEIDMACAKAMQEGKIPYYTLPKPYEVFKGLPKIYTCISVSPVNDERGEFQCFFVEIVPISKSQWLSQSKEILRSYPQLWQNSDISTWIGFIKELSYRDLADWTVRLTIVVTTAYLVVKYGKEKAMSLLGLL